MHHTIYIGKLFVVVVFQFSHPRSISVNKFMNYAHSRYQLNIIHLTSDTSVLFVSRYNVLRSSWRGRYYQQIMEGSLLIVRVSIILD